MASAGSDSATDTENERGSDHQDAGAEIMPIDVLLKEHARINRRNEDLEFRLEYRKAEHKQIVALKDEKIEKLERELERNTQTTQEMNLDIDLLKSKIGQLEKTKKKFEKENATLLSVENRKDVEIKKMADRLKKVNTELHEKQEQLDAKTEQVRLHKKDKERLKRQLDENSRLMAENMVKVMKDMQEQLMAENVKVMKDMQEQQKRDMRKMENRIVRKLEKVRESSDTSPPEAGTSIQDLEFDPANVSGPGNRGTGTSHQRSKGKLPPLPNKNTHR